MNAAFLREVISERVRELLGDFPGFVAGAGIGLNEVVKKLRNEKPMSRSTSARNFSEKQLPEVALWSQEEPNRPRLPRPSRG